MDHEGERQEQGGGQVLDAIMTVAFAAMAGYTIARAVELVETHAPDAAGAAGALGMLALFFTGVSIYEWHTFRKPPGPNKSDE